MNPEDIIKTKEMVRKLLKNSDNGIITIDSGVPGPKTTICVLTHSNEVGGLYAVNELFFENKINLKQGIVQIILVNYQLTLDWEYFANYPQPDDYVLATGECHSVREFVEKAFAVVDMHIEWRGKGLDECGYVDGIKVVWDSKTVCAFVWENPENCYRE